jgi:hypothetical protein
LLKAFLPPRANTMGLATKIDEYVPMIIPSMIAKAKS